MIRLHIMDAADIAVASGDRLQPRALAHVVARFRIDPEIVHARVADLNPVDPRQNVIPPRRSTLNSCVTPVNSRMIQVNRLIYPQALRRNAQFLPGIIEAAKVFDIQVAQFLETLESDP